MTDSVTIVGKVATDPTQARTGGGVSVTNFRLASTHRRFDAATGSWIDAGTNWYSVAAYRQLGEHAKASLRSGDSVIVTGRLRIRNWENNGKQGTSVDIDAEAVGHDLRWGTTAYLRASRSTASEPESRVAEEDRSAVGVGGDGAVDSAADTDAPLDTSWALTDTTPEVAVSTPF